MWAVLSIRARPYPGLWAWEGGDWLLRRESPTPTSYLLDRLIRKGTSLYPWFSRFGPDYISVWVSETAPPSYPSLHPHIVIVLYPFLPVFSPSFFPFPFSSFLVLGSCSPVHGALKLVESLLLPPPRCWDYRHAPPVICKTGASVFSWVRQRDSRAYSSLRCHRD